MEIIESSLSPYKVRPLKTGCEILDEESQIVAHIAGFTGARLAECFSWQSAFEGLDGKKGFLSVFPELKTNPESFKNIPVGKLYGDFFTSRGIPLINCGGAMRYLMDETVKQAYSTRYSNFYFGRNEKKVFPNSEQLKDEKLFAVLHGYWKENNVFHPSHESLGIPHENKTDTIIFEKRGDGGFFLFPFEGKSYKPDLEILFASLDLRLSVEETLTGKKW